MGPMSGYVNTFIGILGTATLAIIGYAIALGTRVNVQEQKLIDLKELINVQFEALGHRFDAINIRLSRIDRALNGRLKE